MTHNCAKNQANQGGSCILGVSVLQKVTLKIHGHRHKLLIVSTYGEAKLNPISPGGGGSEARMAKLTAANQKPLIQ